VPADRIYKLLGNSAPLSFILPSRNNHRMPLLWYDEDKNENRPLRYAINQKSPFEDEQDDNPILQPIIFEDGFLRVPKTNPVLQQFLYYHPMNGVAFAELDAEKDAQKELDNIVLEADALTEARNLSIEQLEMITRVVFGKDPSQFKTAELKRDILVYAKANPAEFLKVVADPELNIQSKVRSFFTNNLLAFRNNEREIWFNTPVNKKKLMTVPFGEDPYVCVASYFKTDDGIIALKMLEKSLS
jgi:hypothetical protein